MAEPGPGRATGADSRKRRPRPLLLLIWIVFAAYSTSVPVAEAQPKFHVGVWFFTWWSHANDYGLALARRLYDRDDPWAGVRDYAEGHGKDRIANSATGASADFADRAPLIGFYDLMQESAVRDEIAMASSEGVDFFSFYWYLNPETGRPRPISDPVDLFFKAGANARLKFALAPLIDPAGPRMKLSTWTDVVVPELVGYMKSPSYYRVAGRPLVIDFNNAFEKPEEWAAAYRTLREAARKELNAEPYIVALLPAQATRESVSYVERRGVADAYTCFHLPIEGNPQPYADLIRNYLPAIKRHVNWLKARATRPVVYIPCGTTGQDRRPWLNEGRAALDLPYNVGTTPQLFRRHLEALRSFALSGKVDTLDTVLLYAWNEWGEAAASIEPSRKGGYSYADVVRDVFGLKPRGARPPPPAP